MKSFKITNGPTQKFYEMIVVASINALYFGVLPSWKGTEMLLASETLPKKLLSSMLS